MYRILHMPHHQHGQHTWCIYPMYDFAHPAAGRLSRASPIRMCSLEFEAHRPLYDWVVENSANANMSRGSIEFARLNLTRTRS